MFNQSQTTFEKLAIRHSATCFLNSFLKEWPAHQVVRDAKRESIRIPLTQGQALRIPLAKYSVLGRHQYTEKFFLERPDQVLETDFAKALELIADFLSQHFQTETSQARIFKDRVLASLRNIQTSLEFRSGLTNGLSAPIRTFRDFEQGLMIGHNFHPTPKSRDEFSDQDMRRFSPEFAASFHLRWIAVDPSVIHQRWAVSFNEHAWTGELALLDLENHDELEKNLQQGFIPLPMHPWQFDVLLKNPAIADYRKQGLLIDLGFSRELWSATSSLRSLYREGSPYMLKYSMTLKLTNSIRHLLINEVERGLQLQDVLATEAGKKFLSEHPNFHVVTEPAYIALKDPSGNPMAETVIVCRQNPFDEKNSQGKAVLATLAQDAPFGGENLLQRLIREIDSPLDLAGKCRHWFALYLENAVKPMVMAQANYGFLLGAHQQNLLLDVSQGWPEKVYFRDCQGTGYSELGFSNFAGAVATISRGNGNVLTEKMGNSLFAYYLILNSTFNVISAICASDWISEKELLMDLRHFLRAMRERGVQDPSCLDYLLNDERLMHKGNFLCAFKSINENTTENPLAIYTPIPNPLLFSNPLGASYAELS